MKMGCKYGDHARRDGAGQRGGRLFELRHRHHPVFRLDDVRDLRLSDMRAIGRRVLTTRRPVVPSAAMARSTRASRSIDARHAGREARPRSARGAAQELLKARPFTLNDLMVNSYGLPEVRRWVEKSERLAAEAQRMDRAPTARKAASASPARTHIGRVEAREWTGEPHATVNLKLDFDGSITVVDRRPAGSPGLVDDPVQVAAEGSALDGSLPHHRVRQRAHAQGNGSYSRASPSWSAMPRSRGRRT